MGIIQGSINQMLATVGIVSRFSPKGEASVEKQINKQIEKYSNLKNEESAKKIEEERVADEVAYNAQVASGVDPEDWSLEVREPTYEEKIDQKIAQQRATEALYLAQRQAKNSMNFRKGGGM